MQVLINAGMLINSITRPRKAIQVVTEQQQSHMGFQQLHIGRFTKSTYFTVPPWQRPCSTAVASSQLRCLLKCCVAVLHMVHALQLLV